MNYQIKIGSQSNPSFSFVTDQILSTNLTFGVDIVGDNLTIDIGTPVVLYDKDEVEYFTPKDYDLVVTADNKEFCTSWVAEDITLLKYGTPCWIYNDSSLIAKMYIKDIVRNGKLEYQLNLISAVGLLDAQNFNGGLYTGTTFSSLVASILGGTVGSAQGGIIPITGGVVDCYLEPEVAGQFVFGHLPVCTKREALHQLMFAYNTVLTKDSNGDIVFSFLYDSQPQAIADANLYMGGDVEYTAPATRVELAEHAYEVLGTEEAEVLFDNSTSGGVVADHTYVYFNNAPIQPNTLNFGTLTDNGHGVNYAIVSGTGVLTGKPYTHVTTSITRNIISSQEERVVTVDSATLVTMANSENVADRLMSYYSSQKTINADIVLTNESCGRLVSFTDPYDETTTQGYIASMDINLSATNKATCKVITDYIPTGHGNNFQHAVVLSGSGTWNIPQEVFTKETPNIKAILIGGGSGGGNGGRGENGGAAQNTGSNVFQDGVGGNGGAGGQGGSGGKVLTQLIDCTGLTSFNYSCGSGGNAGASGGNTTFGTYNSTNGQPSTYGVINLFTSQVYAYKGANGFNGGKGLTGGSNITCNGVTYTVGARGQGATCSQASCSGGNGGGACYGANGGTGGNAQAYDEYGFMHAATGRGGNGATCTIKGANGVSYGCGGGGGHGGGGGGGEGGFTIYELVELNYGGTGGNGSSGGKGANGCVVIYY